MEGYWNFFQNHSSNDIDSILQYSTQQKSFFFLDSLTSDTKQHNAKAQRSYIGTNPIAELIWENGNLLLIQGGETRSFEKVAPSVALEYLDTFLSKNQIKQWELINDLIPQFFITLSYDFGEELILGHSSGKPSLVSFPGLYCCLCQEQLIIDHSTNEIFYYSFDTKRLPLGMLKRRFERFIKLSPSIVETSKVTVLQSNFTKENYLEAIRGIKKYIMDGHIYQVNLSQTFQFSSYGFPENMYTKIRKTNPAPFCSFFKSGNWCILSTSPERFLLKQGERISTEPIKGTRPRGKTLKEDHKNIQELLSSEKEVAEHTMIVDLLRNDLGRICRFGSIKVEEKFYVESYKSVHQLVSKIAGRLKPNTTIGSILRETFPGGSITGTPKKRAMEIIREYEPNKRSAYTGTLGRISCNLNDFDLSILIRSIFIQNHIALLSLGGGIVYDSNELDEYQETIDKGAGIVSALFE
ncbi:MAG: anthranilate synthase component I family protein [Leptospiraceae bacterium]|nr:anthranilate synthase component I family protein [Leptospiraceae bacterium]